MKQFLLFGVLFLGASLNLLGQNSYFNLNIDNDIFFVTDYYYSSGIFLQYGKEHLGDVKKDSLRTFRLFELGQEIYTPSDRYSIDPNKYDYPYGGWTYLKLSRQKEISRNKQYELGAQVGVTGEWSLAQWMQNTYHRTVLGLPNNAWVDQLPKAVHLNIFGQYFYQKQMAGYLRYVNQNYGSLGTQRIHLGSRMGLNIGNGNVFGLGANTLYNQKEGDAFYVGINTAYVLYDYMLEGSLFNNDAPFTLENVPFRYEVEVGFALQSNRWKFLFLYKNRSRDNTQQPKTSHHLMNITLSRFFD